MVATDALKVNAGYCAQAVEAALRVGIASWGVPRRRGMISYGALLLNTDSQQQVKVKE